MRTDFKMVAGCFVDVRGNARRQNVGYELAKELDLNNSACALSLFLRFRVQIDRSICNRMLSTNTDFWFAVT